MAHENGTGHTQIAASANNIPDDSIDCGIRSIGWCTGQNCQKYARLRTFIIILVCVGIVQGSCESYFRISAKEASFENGYNPLIVEWLLVSSGIVEAVFAIVFAYWAFKLHPINWFSGVTILESAICVIAIIPSIMNFSDVIPTKTRSEDHNLCRSSETLERTTLSPEQNKVITLVMLFVLQFGLGFGSLAFYVIGITYLDDNSRSIDSPAVIATALAARIFGLQVGSFVIVGVGATSMGWWLGWAILAPLLFMSGVLIGLYPKRLPKTVIHQAAQRIIEENRMTQFGSQFSNYISDVAFGPSVKRIFGNKLLMFNLLSIMFIQAANVNYMLQEESYLQSRFYLPFNESDGLTQEWQARFVSYFLKPPVAAIGMLVGGLVIAKLKMSGRAIAGVNIALGVHILAIFIAYIFINCDVGPIAGITNGKLEQPYCSSQCSHTCEPTTFLPVCPENATITYFSPCYAGCSRKTTINNVQLYENCSCGMDYGRHSRNDFRATDGACSAGNCFKMLIAFQVLSLSATAFLGATVIGKVLITLRSVLPQDKALALAMQLMLFGLFAYVPVHLAYDVVTRTTCSYWAPEYKRCLLRETPKHGNILNILSACLIFVGILFDILVLIYIKDLNLYNCKVTDANYTSSLYSPIPSEEQQTAIGGSLVTAIAHSSPMNRPNSKPIRPAPHPENIVFRNPSSNTTSSVGENSTERNSGVAYAQIIFPPDNRKSGDSTNSLGPKAVQADLPLQYLSTQDIRAQLSNLRSFSVLNEDTGELKRTKPTLKTNMTEIDTKSRPLSPETDF